MQWERSGLLKGTSPVVTVYVFCLEWRWQQQQELVFSRVMREKSINSFRLFWCFSRRFEKLLIMFCGKEPRAWKVCKWRQSTLDHVMYFYNKQNVEESIYFKEELGKLMVNLIVEVSKEIVTLKRYFKIITLSVIRDWYLMCYNLSLERSHKLGNKLKYLNNDTRLENDNHSINCATTRITIPWFFLQKP